MTTPLRLLNNPRILFALVIFWLSVDLLILGYKAELSKSDWATWIGSIGTVATFIGTIWLATSEQRRRAREEKNLAIVTIAGLVFRISIVKTVLDGAGATLLLDMSANRPTDYAKVAAMLAPLPYWTPEELVAIVGVENHLAARLAFSVAEITGVRTAIGMALGEPLYLDPLISRMFNATTIPRINAQIEVLSDCLAHCKKYQHDSGFSEQSPMAE